MKEEERNPVSQNRRGVVDRRVLVSSWERVVLQLALSPTSLGDATPPARPAIKDSIVQWPCQSVNQFPSILAMKDNIKRACNSIINETC